MTTHQHVGKHNNQPKKRKRGRPKCLKVNNAHQAIIPVLPKTTIQTNPIVVSTLSTQVVQLIDHTGNLVSLHQNKRMGHPNIINLAVPVTSVGSLLISGQKKDNVMGGLVMNSHHPVVTTTSANPIIIINNAGDTLPSTSVNHTRSVVTSDTSTVSSTVLSEEKPEQKGQTKRDKEVHNAEEKRRKAKINSWISKLGSLLSKFPTEKQNKTSILERAFEYINQNEGKGPQIQCEPKLLLRIKNLESIVIMLVDLLKRHSVPIPDNVQIIKVSSNPNQTNSSVAIQNTEKTDINTCPTELKIDLPESEIDTTSNIFNSFPTGKEIIDKNTSEVMIEQNLVSGNMVTSAVMCKVGMCRLVASCAGCNKSTNTICMYKKDDLPVCNSSTANTGVSKKLLDMPVDLNTSTVTTFDLPVVLSSSAVNDIQQVAKLLHVPSSTQLLPVPSINKTCGMDAQNLVIVQSPSITNASLLLQSSIKGVPILEDHSNVPLVSLPGTNLLSTSTDRGVRQNDASGKIEIENSLWRPISSLIPPEFSSVKQVDANTSSVHLNVHEGMSIDKEVKPCISYSSKGMTTNKEVEQYVSSSSESSYVKQVIVSECGKIIPSSSTSMSLSNVVMDQKMELFTDNNSYILPSNKVIIIQSDFSLPLNNVSSATVISTIASSSIFTVAPVLLSSSSIMAAVKSVSVSSVKLSSAVSSIVPSPLVSTAVPCSSFVIKTSIDPTCPGSSVTTCDRDYAECSVENLTISSNDTIINKNCAIASIDSISYETKKPNRMRQSKIVDNDRLHKKQLKCLKTEKPQDLSGLNTSPSKNMNNNYLNRSPSKNVDMKQLEKDILTLKSCKANCDTKSDMASTNKNSNDIISTNRNQCIVSSANDIPLQGFGIDNLLIISSTASVNLSKSKHSPPMDCITYVESGDTTEKSKSPLSTCKVRYNSRNSNTFSPMKKGIANSVKARPHLSTSGHTVASLLETTSSLSEFEVQIKRNVNPHYVSTWNDVSSNSTTLFSNSVGVMSFATSNVSSYVKSNCISTSNKTLTKMASSNQNCNSLASSSTLTSVSTNNNLSNTTTSSESLNIALSNNIMCTSTNMSTCSLTSTNDISYINVSSRNTCSNMISANICNKIPFTNMASSNSNITSVNNDISETAEKKCAVSSYDLTTSTSMLTQRSSKHTKHVLSTTTCTHPTNTASQHNSVKQVTLTTSSANYSTKRWGNVLENAHNSDMLLSCFTLGNRKRQRNKNRMKSSKKTQVNETPHISAVSYSSQDQNITSFSSKSNSLNSTKSNQINSISGASSQCSSNIASSNNITSSPPAYSEAIALNMYSITQSVNSSANKNSCIVTSTNEIPFTYITSINGSEPTGASTADCKWIIKSSVSLAEKPNINNSAAVSNGEEILNGSCGNSSIATNISTYSTSSSTSVSTNTAPNSYNTPLIIKSNIVCTMKDRTIRNKWLEMEQGKNNDASSQVPCCTATNQQVDQCASPVISFPNQCSRKRSMVTVQNEREVKRLAQCSVDVDENSSHIFSAESLCQSAIHKDDELKCCKTNVKISKISEPQKHNTAQQKLEHAVHKLKHQPDTPYSNSLPTILNIFAPAPVPASTTNQSNLSTGISNFSAESLVNNDCNVNMMGNNMADVTFQDTMLMGANSQLFTNFSADTLLSDNESAAAYTEENIIAQNNTNQMSQYWNNSWLSQDIALSDSVFSNPSNMQNNMQRQQRNNLQASTECSPIKSIMSILQSTPNNNQNINFDNFNDSTINNIMPPHAMVNRFPHRNRRIDNQLNAHSNISVNTSQWNKNHTNNISQVTSNKGFCSESMMPTWNNHIANNHCPSNREQMQLNNMNISNMNTRITYQNAGAKVDARNKKESNGPMFGNYPLVSSAGS